MVAQLTVIWKPEKLGTMLRPALGKLEKQPEVLAAVLHIVLHLRDHSIISLLRQNFDENHKN